MSDHGQRHLKADQFVNYCKQLNLHTSTSVLECYERDKLLFPSARILISPEYLKYMFDIEHNPSNPFYRKITYEYPPEWKGIHDLLRDINFRFGRDVPGIHIIDRLINKSDYVVHPEEFNFAKWNSFKVPAGKINDSEIRQSTALHFYHYWQAYQIYEIQKYTDGDFKTTMIDKFTAEERQKFAGYITIPVPKSKARDGDYLGIAEGFEPLSILSYFYHVKYSQLVLEGKKTTDGFVELDEQRVKRLHKNTKRLSQILSRKYNFDGDSQYAFLKKLCSLHDEYTRAEKPKLAESMQRDIARMIRFIQFYTGADFKSVSQRIGRIGGRFDDYLNFLFPDEIEEVRKRAMPTIESHLEDYNKHFPTYQIDTAGLVDFLSFIETEEFYIFFQTISDLNDHWFKDRSPIVAAKISELLTDLALLPEKIMDKIGRKGFPGTNFQGYMLKKYLKQFFQGESWFAELDSNWGAETRFGDTVATIQQLQDLLYRRTLSSVPANHEVLRVLYVSGLIRNFHGHRHALLKDYEKDFLAILRCIFYFIFLIWYQSKINLRLL